MQISKLRLGSSGVDLAHVSPFILFMHIRDVQKPRSVFVVGHADSRISRNHVIVHRQDGRLLKVHPRNLQQKRIHRSTTFQIRHVCELRVDFFSSVGNSR